MQRQIGLTARARGFHDLYVFGSITAESQVSFAWRSECLHNSDAASKHPGPSSFAAGVTFAMDWELSKENFQPLKRGRDPEKLEQAVASPSESKVALEKTRRYDLVP